MHDSSYSTTYSSAMVQYAGALPCSIAGLYNEYQVINYTGTTLYMNTINGDRIVIANNTNGASAIPRRVEINIRTVLGAREISSHGPENWKGRILKIVIDSDTITNHPVYVKEIDAILYLDKFIGIQHPRHDTTGADYAERAQQVSGSADTRSPYIININDPSNKIKSLYTIVNGRLCSITVNHWAHYPEACSIMYRDPHDVKYTPQETFSLDDLLKNTGTVTTDKDTVVYLATNRLVLETAIKKQQIEESKLVHPDSIQEFKETIAKDKQDEIDGLTDTISALNAKLAKQRAEHEETLSDRTRVHERYKQTATLQAGEDKDTIVALNKRIEALLFEINVKTDARERDLKLKSLDNAEKEIGYKDNKLVSNEKKDQCNEHIAELKVKKEEHSVAASSISTTGSVVKAAAVLAPLAVAATMWVTAPAVAGITAFTSVTEIVASLVPTIIAAAASYVGSAYDGVCSCVSTVADVAYDCAASVCDSIGSFFSWLF